MSREFGSGRHMSGADNQKAKKVDGESSKSGGDARRMFRGNQVARWMATGVPNDQRKECVKRDSSSRHTKCCRPD